jgi:hypothetical protein
MNKFTLFKRGWWLLHIVTIAFMFYLGHIARF